MEFDETERNILELELSWLERFGVVFKAKSDQIIVCLFNNFIY